LSWRLDNRRKWILLGLAASALLLQGLLEQTRAPARQGDYELKLAAAEQADAAFAAIRAHRLRNDAQVDLINDPAGTGLIGPEFSQITNARGDLEAKLTSLNPNFAGLMVQYFRQAGLKPGDAVAVALSGSFPGINISLFAALESMKLRPVVVTSIGASMWGANDPEFTWLDMESLFYDQGIFHTRSSLASYGGGNDMGRGLSPAGRQLIRDAAARNGLAMLHADNIEDAIAKRMAFYEEAGRSRSYALYVNVGGGVASLGSSHNRLLLPHGLSFDISPHNYPRKGNLIRFAEKGVPVVHILNIVDLARKNGLPVSPDLLPLPGEGQIFVREMYRLPLAIAILLVYCLACVMILAPELRRGLFDHLPAAWRRAGTTTALALVLGSCLAAPAAAQSTGWITVKPVDAPGSVCLDVSGREIDYHLVEAGEPAAATIRGPYRLKLITRYLFADEEASDDVKYSLRVSVDGIEVLRKTFTGKAHAEVSRCGDTSGAVSALRKAYIELPSGHHDVKVAMDSDGTGSMALRLFRETKRKTDPYVPFAPEQYEALVHVQFASGNQSTYYHFDAAQPLAFTVTGPTTLKVYSRLDFDHTMNGSQSYSLEVVCDGEPWRQFHFNAKKLSSAVIVERPDILPGTRKQLRIPVPNGTHHYEIRCVRPEACGIAAQIRIPKADIQR